MAFAAKSSDQDCDCVVHTGPHWKHMDALWRARNQELLKGVSNQGRSLEQRQLAFYAFCQEELARLAEKSRILKSLEQAA